MTQKLTKIDFNLNNIVHNWHPFKNEIQYVDLIILAFRPKHDSFFTAAHVSFFIAIFNARYKAHFMHMKLHAKCIADCFYVEYAGPDSQLSMPMVRRAHIAKQLSIKSGDAIKGKPTS